MVHYGSFRAVLGTCLPIIEDTWPDHQIKTKQKLQRKLHAERIALCQYIIWGKATYQRIIQIHTV